MSTAISVENLVKHYGAVQAVRGVSFEVQEGEIFGLLGPNGAGKTSTLECIIGLRRPDGGDISIAGIDALAQPAKARALIGAQLQWTALQDKITPRQALHFFASFYPRHADIEQLIAQFNLGKKANASFDTLSGGQRQRLAVALAMVNQPRVLFLDEPAAGLDPLSRRELIAIIAGLKAAGQTIVLTTHHIDEAHRLCDRVGIMSEGAIAAVDTPAALIAASKVPPWIFVRTKRDFSPPQPRLIKGVTFAFFSEGRWRLETKDMTQTIQSLMQLLQAEHNELVELEIRRPTLEDVFLSLTGTPLNETPAESSGPKEPD